MKKKKNFTKNKKGKNDHAAYILSVLKNLGAEASLQKLFPKVLRKMSQEEIILALNKLDHSGLIQFEKKGKIKLLSEEKKSSHSRKSEHEYIGFVDVARTGAVFVAVEGLERDVFVLPRKTMNALQGDEVKVRITSFGRRPEGEITQIINHSQDTFIGKLEVLEKFAFFIADERNLNSDVFIPLNHLGGAVNHDKVIVRVTNWNTGTKNPVGEVLEILSGKHSSDRDMKMILIENGFSIDFPRNVYAELDKFGDTIPKSEIDKRLDLRNVTTFTIDPIDARDFDDAISFRELDNGHIEVGVHIADVSHYVVEGSPLDKEAERRATSVYLPDRVCPMLPERLSNELCSLRPKEDKLTFSAIFEFDKKFNLQSSTIARTVIHSDRRFTYEQAQEVLETGEGDFVHELTTLDKMAKHFRAKRFANGAIGFEKEEVRFRLDETGKPIDLIVKVRKDAHLLVEDFMLLANETVAKFGAQHSLKKHKQAFVYRVHDKPDPAKLEQFSTVASRFGYHIRFKQPEDASGVFNELFKKIQGKPEQNVLESMAIRTMAKATYTTGNIGHYGLAMQYYTHFTSPIRRYPDVMVHRLLNNILTESDRIVSKEEIEAACKNSSLMERRAMDAEREAIKYKQIEFLQDKIGEEFDAIITGIIPRGVFAEISENKCEGMISTELLGREDFMYDEKAVRLIGMRSGKRFDLGDAVRVKVLSADIELRRIDLALVIEGEEENYPVPPKTKKRGKR